MPALAESQHAGRIAWLGLLPDRRAGMRSAAVKRLALGFDGIEGDGHSGLTRPACTRVAMLHRRGTRIRNARQLSVLSVEEMRQIAEKMGLKALDPAHLGASLVVEGIPDLSHLPPGARLQAPDGATLTVDLENGPCLQPAREIEADHPGMGMGFREAAMGLRGITAWVEREGTLALGDTLRLFVPTQRGWQPGA